MSPEDTRGLADEYRAKLGALVEGAALDSLVSCLEACMFDVLMSRGVEDASMMAAFEKVSECLVSSGLASETKLEDNKGVYILTASDHVLGVRKHPGAGVEKVIGDMMQRLVEMKTGVKYHVEVTKAARRTEYSFNPR